MTSRKCVDCGTKLPPAKKTGRPRTLCERCGDERQRIAKVRDHDKNKVRKTTSFVLDETPLHAKDHAVLETVDTSEPCEGCGGRVTVSNDNEAYCGSCGLVAGFVR